VSEAITISAIQASLNKGETSLSSIVSNFIEKIESKKQLNAFLEVFGDEALLSAKVLDEKRIAGAPTGKLHGLVIGIKDNICYKGHKVSGASKILEDLNLFFRLLWWSDLLAEDAIIIGRLNCDEFAMGSSNENSAYGNVRNALDESREYPGAHRVGRQ
jgi:aspartyl-tRNA(Asn)/glutamyl-tRNA(Gln) amidotransferase subunit A